MADFLAAERCVPHSIMFKIFKITLSVNSSLLYKCRITSFSYFSMCVYLYTLCRMKENCLEIILNKSFTLKSKIDVILCSARVPVF